jgi:hypothetical protein
VDVFHSLHCKVKPSVIASCASLIIWLAGFMDLLLGLFAPFSSPTSLNKEGIKIRSQDAILFTDIYSNQFSITYPLSHRFGMNSQLFSDFFHGEHFLCHGFNSYQRLEPILPYEDVRVKLCLFMAV